jgi:hypothetical protein
MPHMPIGKIRHEIGHAFIFVTGKPSLSCHSKPSSAILLENGIPLPGPANVLHDDIRSLGGGRYSFWKGTVYFSTPDNSDPRTNGRQYVIVYEQCAWRSIGFLRRLVVPARRATGILCRKFQGEQRRQMIWGALYWICFAYVALCRKHLVWRNKGP